MNLVIQMMMLIAGAILLMLLRGQAVREIANGAVFKGGHGRFIFLSVFRGRLDEQRPSSDHDAAAQGSPSPTWCRAALDPRPGMCSSLSSWRCSRAAALAASRPTRGWHASGGQRHLIAFLPRLGSACIALPTYPSDASATIRLPSGKVHHRPSILPGLIGVAASCTLGCPDHAAAERAPVRTAPAGPFFQFIAAYRGGRPLIPKEAFLSPLNHMHHALYHFPVMLFTFQRTRGLHSLGCTRNRIYFGKFRPNRCGSAG